MPNLNLASGQIGNDQLDHRTGQGRRHPARDHDQLAGRADRVYAGQIRRHGFGSDAGAGTGTRQPVGAQGR